MKFWPVLKSVKTSIEYASVNTGLDFCPENITRVNPGFEPCSRMGRRSVGSCAVGVQCWIKLYFLQIPVAIFITYTWQKMHLLVKRTVSM